MCTDHSESVASEEVSSCCPQVDDARARQLGDDPDGLDPRRLVRECDRKCRRRLGQLRLDGRRECDRGDAHADRVKLRGGRQGGR